MTSYEISKEIMAILHNGQWHLHHSQLIDLAFEIEKQTGHLPPWATEQELPEWATNALRKDFIKLDYSWFEQIKVIFNEPLFEFDLDEDSLS